VVGLFIYILYLLFSNYNFLGAGNVVLMQTEMNRKTFLQTILTTAATMTLLPDSLKALGKLNDELKENGHLMPAFFIGHGSPMNGIEDNDFSRSWAKIGKEYPTPVAVLVVSAHWLTKGTKVTAMDFPKTIHDFGGFPKALYEVEYKAPGSPAVAKETQQLIHRTHVEADHEWGLDHGTWTIVRHVYPDAHVPVLQLSIDYTKDARYHYELAKELFALRKKGVMIIGSGNLVHNLGMVAWEKLSEPEYGFEWAYTINNKFKELIANGNHDALIDYRNLGKEATLAIPTPDHYLPLIYTLALQQKHETVSFFNDKAVGGSLTMTSVKIA
jgi:4,5-DOPA dioxygenase extradiol